MNKKNTALVVALGSLLVSSASLAKVDRTGTWPEHDKAVTLSLDHASRSDAVKRLADEAGWSVVLRAPDDEKVDVHVKDEDASKVLGVLLDDQDFVAARDGNLITISRAKAEPAAAAPAATAAPPAPVPTTRGEDRSVQGGELFVGPNEVVHDLHVMGGEVELQGTATGNVSVMGGTLHMTKGAHVVGNVTTVGGEVEMDDGATVDGRIGSLGGEVKRGDRTVSSGNTLDERERPRSGLGLLERIGHAITASAMLFVFGAVLLALGDRKMETLRLEIASRPARSFALGIVGVLAAIVGVVALCVTVVGVPVAVIFALLAVFAGYAGVCAVLGTAGRALVGHKTESPYLHLAVGCVLMLFLGSIPWVGDALVFVVAMAGVGVVVATRGAGTWPKKGAPGPQDGPYRTALS